MKIKRSGMVLFLLLLAGALLGSALWYLLSPVLPGALTKSFSIGTTSGPWTIGLIFIELTFGATLNLNIGSLLGMIIAVTIFYKA